MSTRYYEETPCEVCELYETGEHFDQVGDWCDGAGGQRRELIGEAIEWCVEHEAPEGDDGQCLTALEYPVSERCRIVSMLLVPPSVTGS